MTLTIRDRLRERAEAVENALRDSLALRREHPSLARLEEALLHGALGGGKRLRPFLVLESAAAVGGEAGKAMAAAIAVEMVHSYSLVHDDLPAMDDAETRRGKPSVHVAFDDATAVLVGDALLTEAFAVIADAGYPPQVAVKLISRLAAASGRDGMVGGQMMDLFPQEETEAEVVAIQARKTGALIEASALMGGIVAGADEEALSALSSYSRALGLAFQVRDDLLDATADAATLGKPAGRDEEAGKATFVGLYGLEGAREKVEALTAEARAALSPLPKRDVLEALADYLVVRES
jgi:farnesyl diphosphate synthase